jgi:hypothetical protein
LAFELGEARIAAAMHYFTDLAGACADDADRDDLRAAAFALLSLAARWAAVTRLLGPSRAGA